jgi:dienelactone hydrolase
MLKSNLAGGAALAACCWLATSALAETLTGPSGPYQVVMEMDNSLPEHTIYRPADMKAVKGKLPVLAFGNGGCIPIGNAYRVFLGEVVSHGYLAIASGPIGVEPQMPAAPPPGAGRGRAAGPPPDMLRNQTKTESMIQSIDWAIKENGRKESPYFNKIDTQKVVVLGHSCGGLMAIAAAADPRVTTAIIMNSGNIRTPPGGAAPALYLPSTEADLPNLHTPMLYIIGGPTDVAYSGSEADFTQITQVPVFNANLPIGHGGSWREPAGGKMGKVAFDWLNWQLKGDKAAAKTFVGAECGLCANKEWTIKRANWKF